MTTCDTVTVTITHDEAGTVTLTVPAYTVPAQVLRERLGHLQAAYLDSSATLRQPTSLADFALFLLRQAANDPRQQER